MSSNKRSWCIVPGCTETLRKEVENLTVHRFPSPTVRKIQREKWVEIMRNLKGVPDWEPEGHSCICSRHFESSVVYSTGKPGKGRKLFCNACPTLCLGPGSDEGSCGNIPEAEAENIPIPEVADEEVILGPDWDIYNNDLILDEKLEENLNVSELPAEETTSDAARNFQICCPKCEEKIVIDLGDGETPQSFLSTSFKDSSEDAGTPPKRNKMSESEKLSPSTEEESVLPEEVSTDHSAMEFNVPSIIALSESKKYLLAEHSYARPPNEADSELISAKAEVENWRRKYWNVKHQLVRREKTANNLKLKLEESQNLTQRQLKSLENQLPEFLKTLISSETYALSLKGKEGMEYDEDIKKFATKLHSYSPRAYSFVRGYLTLPHPSTIKSWNKTSESGPG